MPTPPWTANRCALRCRQWAKALGRVRKKLLYSLRARQKWLVYGRKYNRKKGTKSLYYKRRIEPKNGEKNRTLMVKKGILRPAKFFYEHVPGAAVARVACPPLLISGFRSTARRGLTILPLLLAILRLGFQWVTSHNCYRN